MTPQENAALIKGGYEAFGKGDIPAVMGIFSDDVSWHIPGRSPLAGEYHGPDEVLGFFQKLQERSEGSFRLELHDVLASDDHVVVLAHEIAHRGDNSLNTLATHVWHVRDGRATEFWGIVADTYSVDAFWS